MAPARQVVAARPTTWWRYSQFGSLEVFGQAAKLHGKEIMGDIANFTDAKPVVQFNEELS